MWRTDAMLNDSGKNIRHTVYGDKRKDVQEHMHLCDPVMLNVAPDSGMKIPSHLRQSQAQILPFNKPAFFTVLLDEDNWGFHILF